MKKFILRLIKLYQKTLSPDHGWMNFFYPQGYCRFYPSCSSYSYQAIEKYGLLKGSLKALKRILRCHPWQRGGWDPLD